MRLALATAAVLTVAMILLLARRQAAGRVVAITGAAVSVAALVPMAATGRQSLAISLFQLLAGAAFLGAATNRCSWATGTSPIGS